MVFFCNVISQDHVIKGKCDLMGSSLSQSASDPSSSKLNVYPLDACTCLYGLKKSFDRVLCYTGKVKNNCTKEIYLK